MSAGKKKPAGVRSYLKARRQSAGMTQAELAVYSGQSATTIARIDKGNISISLETLWRVCGVLGAAPSDIYPMLKVRPKRMTRVLKRGNKAGGAHDRRAAKAFDER